MPAIDCCASIYPHRKMFFDDIRALTRYLCFESWQKLLESMLEQLEIPFPQSV